MDEVLLKMDLELSGNVVVVLAASRSLDRTVTDRRCMSYDLSTRRGGIEKSCRRDSNLDNQTNN